MQAGNYPGGSYYPPPPPYPGGGNEEGSGDEDEDDGFSYNRKGLRDNDSGGTCPVCGMGFDSTSARDKHTPGSEACRYHRKHKPSTPPFDPTRGHFHQSLQYGKGAQMFAASGANFGYAPAPIAAPLAAGGGYGGGWHGGGGYAQVPQAPPQHGSQYRATFQAAAQHAVPAPQPAQFQPGQLPQLPVRVRPRPPLPPLPPIGQDAPDPWNPHYQCDRCAFFGVSPGDLVRHKTRECPGYGHHPAQ